MFFVYYFAGFDLLRCERRPQQSDSPSANLSAKTPTGSFFTGKQLQLYIIGGDDAVIGELRPAVTGCVPSSRLGRAAH